MKMAKADKEDFKALRDFLNACDNVLEREKWSLRSPEENWKGWDEDDEDRKLIERIRYNESRESGRDEEDIDPRILMYEFLQYKFKNAYGWQRVYWAADILIDNVCDPTEDCLAFYPGFNLNHVEAEQ
jgi:hypothetical protein